MKHLEPLASSTIQTKLLCLESEPFQLHWWCVFTTTLCTTMERTSNCVFILLPWGFDWAPHLASLCTGQWSVYLADSLSKLTWCYNEHTLALCYSLRADMHNPGLSSMRQCYQLLLAPSAHVSSVESLKKGADKQTAPLRHAQRGKLLCSVHWRAARPSLTENTRGKSSNSFHRSTLFFFCMFSVILTLQEKYGIWGQYLVRIAQQIIQKPCHRSVFTWGRRDGARCLCSRCFLQAVEECRT